MGQIPAGPRVVPVIAGVALLAGDAVPVVGAPLFAIAKAAIVFGGTLALSMATTFAVQRFSWGARLIGAPPRAVATS